MEKDSKRNRKENIVISFAGKCNVLYTETWFVPYVKKCKKTLDENTILVYYTTMTVIQKEVHMEYNSSLPIYLRQQIL